jgi:hypothetical protein
VLGTWFLGQCSDNIRLKNFASANRVFLILPNVLVCNMNLPTIFKTMWGGATPTPPPPLGTPLCLDFVIRPG